MSSDLVIHAEGVGEELPPVRDAARPAEAAVRRRAPQVLPRVRGADGRQLRRRARARPSASSGATARASRRCCRSSAARCSPPPAASTTHGRIAAMLELGAGFSPEFSGRENIFLNGYIVGLTQQEIEARLRRHLRVRRHRRLHRAADQDLLDRHGRAARVRRHGARRRGHPGDRRGARRGRRALRAEVHALPARVQGTRDAAVRQPRHDGGGEPVRPRALARRRAREGAAGRPSRCASSISRTCSRRRRARRGKPTRRARAIARDRLRRPRRRATSGSTCSRRRGHRTDVEIFEFDPASASFGRRGARIADVRIEHPHGERLAWAVGGETVVVVHRHRGHRAAREPDRRLSRARPPGPEHLRRQHVPHVARPAAARWPRAISRGARFEFDLPLLPPGNYSIAVAVADGHQAGPRAARVDPRRADLPRRDEQHPPFAGRRADARRSRFDLLEPHVRERACARCAVRDGTASTSRPSFRAGRLRPRDGSCRARRSRVREPAAGPAVRAVRQHAALHGAGDGAAAALRRRRHVRGVFGIAGRAATCACWRSTKPAACRRSSRSGRATSSSRFPDVDMQRLPHADGRSTWSCIPTRWSTCPIRCAASPSAGACCAIGGAAYSPCRSSSAGSRAAAPGLPPSYHGDPAKGDGYLVHTEFGADAWRWPLAAGFADCRIVSLEHPAAHALIAVR